ncbi:GNAT family N-acetyltransferase [Lactiplantibacillus daowaiensis]|uniref:GNAT family N-acetyltransferase n=1 Tax=Lactiplantibacillus daowaiensis TaxID=2559918 RepID=A0ABW1S3J4_9LACO
MTIHYLVAPDIDRKTLMPLFLLGDDDQAKVAAYYQTGTLVVAQSEAKIVGLALLVADDTADTVELKNIAVSPTYQGQQIGTHLVQVALQAMASTYTTMIVGTGDADVANIRFYLKNGFRFIGVKKGFFLSYAKPIMVDGIALQDMVMLGQTLRKA